MPMKQLNLWGKPLNAQEEVEQQKQVEAFGKNDREKGPSAAVELGEPKAKKPRAKMIGKPPVGVEQSPSQKPVPNKHDQWLTRLNAALNSTDKSPLSVLEDVYNEVLQETRATGKGLSQDIALSDEAKMYAQALKDGGSARGTFGQKFSTLWGQKEFVLN